MAEKYVCQGCGLVHEEAEIKEGPADVVRDIGYELPAKIEGSWEYWECDNCGKRHRISGLDPTDEDPKARRIYEDRGAWTEWSQ